MPDNICLRIEEIRPCLRNINLYSCAQGFDSGSRILYHHYFLYVHKGKGRVIIGSNEYVSISGDLYYCPPGTPNTIQADVADPFLLSGIDFDFTANHAANQLRYPIQSETFNPDLVTEYVNFENFAGFPDKISLSDDEAIHELVYKMIEPSLTRKKYWELTANAFLQAFIIAVVQRIEQSGLGMGNVGKADKIIEYLAQYYPLKLTNIALGREFHYHPDYVSKVVCSYTGMSLKQYIINLRIRAALSYLNYTNLSLKDIAVQTGFNNVHYFTRIFKNKTGLTPGSYRKNNELLHLAP